MKNENFINSYKEICLDKEEKEVVLRKILSKRKRANIKSISIAACFLIVFAGATTLALGNVDWERFITPAGPADLITTYLGSSSTGNYSTAGVEISEYNGKIKNDNEIIACLVGMTEDELINDEYNNIIIEGTVINLQNIQVKALNYKEYYTKATIKVSDVIRGEGIEDEVVVLLPEYGFSRDFKEVIKQIKTGNKGIFMIHKHDDSIDYREYAEGVNLVFSDLAPYRISQRQTFIQAGNSLHFSRFDYPSLLNAKDLDEVKTFLLWKLGKGSAPIPYDDNKFQLNPAFDVETWAVSYEQARKAAEKERTGGGWLRGVNPFLWTYGTQVFSEETLDKNPKLKETGYPKDLPVYVVEFADVKVTSNMEGRDTTNMYYIIDATSGLVLLSYAGDTMFIN